jgi:hypothetical protein
MIDDTPHSVDEVRLAETLARLALARQQVQEDAKPIAEVEAAARQD